METNPSAGTRGPDARVLMIGWEFPPAVAGGPGTACAGLVRGLRSLGCEISLVLPRRPRTSPPRLAAAAEPRFRLLSVPTPDAVPPAAADDPRQGPDFPGEVLRVARRVTRACLREEFDVIHAHDWMSFPAAIALQRASGKPWIAHVHATEFARSGGAERNEFVATVEREGTQRADRVICVSRRTAGVVHRRYGVPAGKIRVVHSAIDSPAPEEADGFPTDRPLVLFAGRLTRQKAPACFLEAARRVLQRRPDVDFVLAGQGDRLPWLRERAKELGIADRVAFAGFLPPAGLAELYRRASVFALPSLREPFGRSVLEAAQRHVPAIVSRDAGVTEVVRSVIPVDPGDAEGLARRILFLLESPVYRWLLARHAAAEVAGLSWRRAAEQCLRVYAELTGPEV